MWNFKLVQYTLQILHVSLLHESIWIPDALLVLYFQVNGLARRYPGLMSLRSVDLSPASWMAVAWYFSFSVCVCVCVYVGQIINSLAINKDRRKGHCFHI